LVHVITVIALLVARQLPITAGDTTSARLVPAIESMFHCAVSVASIMSHGVAIVALLGRTDYAIAAVLGDSVLMVVMAAGQR
jgi:hypothetical protein